MGATAPAAASEARRLSRQERAFIRCWAEGVDIGEAWHRYLADDGARDTRRARATLQALLDQLQAQARALGRPELAALLRMRAAVPASPAAPAPTLEAFRADIDADFYSEAELLELYRQRHGQDGQPSTTEPISGTASARHRRLRQRLGEALLWLERQAPREPRPEDPIAAWLDARLAARLAVAGLHTLGELMARAGRGGAWFQGIPRLGPVGAERLADWLRGHEASLGRLGHPEAPVPGDLGLRPLERLARTAAASGAAGRLGDVEAVKAWVDRRAAGSHTWRAYRREAERFLLWAQVERRQPLAALTPEDVRAYALFLAAPGPAWTAPRHTARHSSAWRPFEGPLSPASRAIAARILRLLCDDLVAQGHLACNPWRSEEARAAVEPVERQPVRALSRQAVGHLRAWMAAQPPSPALRRLRAAVELACGCGLRRSELAAARGGWLGAAGTRPGAVALEVQTGPAGSRRTTLPAAAVESFRESLTDRHPTPGFPSNEPFGAAAAPWIARLDDGGALSPARLYEVLKQGFRRCAEDLAARHPQAAASIAVASPHWLRHTHGVAALAQGVPPARLQAALGHRSRAMVAAYRREVPRWEGRR